MNTYNIRHAEPADLPRLKSIWRVCFGDSAAETDRFFEAFFDKCSALVLCCGGVTAAAAYILYISELVEETGRIIPCPYIYGVGVLPGYRGRGFGSLLTNEAVKLCEDRGYELCCLVPASAKLFDFYREKSGFAVFFTVDEHVYGTPPEKRPAGVAEKISAQEYSLIRERILSGRKHMRFSSKACRYMELTCSAAGGGLFRLPGFENAVAAASLEKDTLLIKELLCQPEDTHECINLLAGYFRAEKCIARTPGGGKPFGMIRAPGSGISPAASLSAAYMGFAFD